MESQLAALAYPSSGYTPRKVVPPQLQVTAGVYTIYSKNQISPPFFSNYIFSSSAVEFSLFARFSALSPYFKLFSLFSLMDPKPALLAIFLDLNLGPG